MGILRTSAYYRFMVDFIFKPITKINYHAYGKQKIFVLLDKGFDISPKIFFEKSVIFYHHKTGACYMGQVSWYMGHSFYHVLVIAEG